MLPLDVTIDGSLPVISAKKRTATKLNIWLPRPRLSLGLSMVMYRVRSYGRLDTIFGDADGSNVFMRQSLYMTISPVKTNNTTNGLRSFFFQRNLRNDIVSPMQHILMPSFYE